MRGYIKVGAVGKMNGFMNNKKDTTSFRRFCREVKGTIIMMKGREVGIILICGKTTF
jgi:hypothetical protein